MGFHAAVAWIEERLGRVADVSVGGPADTRSNTFGHLYGVLGPGTGEFQLIDPRGHNMEAFSVGAGRLQLVEGDFVSAERQLDLEADFLIMHFREVRIVISVEAEPAGVPAELLAAQRLAAARATPPRAAGDAAASHRVQRRTRGAHVLPHPGGTLQRCPRALRPGPTTHVRTDVAMVMLSSPRSSSPSASP